MHFFKSITRGVLALVIFIPLSLFGDKISLYEDRVWKGLLHLDTNDKPKIDTPTFLLSHENFSPKNELELTVKAFQKNPQVICKYPARYLWLKEKRAVHLETFDLKSCGDFETYRKNTNPYAISLVFVSEDVAEPTSMMGHIFFKLDGINQHGRSVSNAVSFYTVIESLNLAYLALESTLLGMKGYFVMKPYHKQIAQYIENKERNVWEYKLGLTQAEIRLLSYHFWELKEVDMKYYFTGYNCATVVEDMLRIVKESPQEQSLHLWVTPKDVIKEAAKLELIEETKVRNTTTLDKNPIYAQDDSQLSMTKHNGEDALYLSFLPASHTLYDDNRQYSFESSLKIAEISLKMKNDSIDMDEFNLFGMQSLVPWSKERQIFSKALSISYTKHLDKNLNLTHAYNISYATGITFKLGNDAFVYNLLGVGLAYGAGTSYINLHNRVGVMLYEVFDMKSTIEYTSYYNNFHSKQLINSLDMTQSLNVLKKVRIDMKYQYNHTHSLHNETFMLKVNFIL